MLWYIAVSIVISALGIFLFLKPDIVWKMTESWKSYRADTPSELFLMVTKAGGMFFALFGIVMIVLRFVLK